MFAYTSDTSASLQRIDFDAAVTPSRKAVPVKSTCGDFRKMELDVVITWQLRGLRGK